MATKRVPKIFNLNDQRDRDILYDYSLAKLEGYRSLPAGWDGYYAATPKPALIDAAIKFLRRLFSEKLMVLHTMVGPSSVGLYWNSSANLGSDASGYVDFEFELSDKNVTTYSAYLKWRRAGVEGELWCDEQPIDGDIDPDIIKYFKEVCKWE